MIVDIKVPSPGESITEVEIENWLVEDGSVVEMDAELAEINSDKATLTVNATATGKITLTAKAGDTVNVGQVIATIETSVAAGAQDTPTQNPPKSEKGNETTTVSEKIANPAAEKMIREPSTHRCWPTWSATTARPVALLAPASSTPPKHRRPTWQTSKRWPFSASDGWPVTSPIAGSGRPSTTCLLFRWPVSRPAR